MEPSTDEVSEEKPKLKEDEPVEDEVDLGSVRKIPYANERTKVLRNCTNYTMLSRKGKAVKIVPKEDDLFVTDGPRNWDTLQDIPEQEPWHVDSKSVSYIVSCFRSEIGKVAFTRYLKKDKRTPEDSSKLDNADINIKTEVDHDDGNSTSSTEKMDDTESLDVSFVKTEEENEDDEVEEASKKPEKRKKEKSSFGDVISRMKKDPEPPEKKETVEEGKKAEESKMEEKSEEEKRKSSKQNSPSMTEEALKGDEKLEGQQSDVTAKVRI